MSRGLVLVLFFLSGATGLVYELVWVRELIFVFGGTTHAITTVLVAFMAGLGLGSYAAGRWCTRLREAGRAYGILELAIGGYALLVPVLLHVAEPAYRAAYPSAAQHPMLLTLLRFALSTPVVLLPATLMGATLPLLVRYVTQRGAAPGSSVSLLYGTNTLGAVLGVITAGFLLLPGYGLTATTRIAAGVNACVGLLALLLLHQGGSLAGVAARRARETSKAQRRLAPESSSPAVRRIVLASFAVSGFAAMVYQIMWNRVLVLSLGSSTHAFTCILAAFILGLALGSLVLARWVDRWQHPVFVFGVLEILLGLTAAAIVPLHGQVPRIADALVVNEATNYSRLLAWQFVVVVAVTVVPTFLMGAIFPVVTRALVAPGTEAATAAGRAYGVNTLGTVAGAFLGGFVLIRSDVLGVQNSIVVASLLNGAAGVLLMVVAQPAAGVPWWRRALVPTVALIVVTLPALGARWNTLLITSAPFLHRASLAQRTDPQSRRLLYFAEGPDLTVTVEQTGEIKDLLSLTVNGKPDASTGFADMTTQLLLGHLPALVGPPGGDVCVIGLGSGVTLGALATHSGFTRLDCAEISAEVLDAARLFDRYTYSVCTADPRVNVIPADGRNHLLLTQQQYDLIVSEPSNPWITGVANLFTQEFFQIAAARLKPAGVLGVWLHGYGMAVDDFRMVLRTLLECYPHVSLWELNQSDYLMLAAQSPLHVTWPEFARRFAAPRVRADLMRAALARPGQILGRFIAGTEPLRAWTQSAALHTDDRAQLEFSAPRYLYENHESEIARALFALREDVFAEVVHADGVPPGVAREVASTRRAREALEAINDGFRAGDYAAVLRRLDAEMAADPVNQSLLVMHLDAAVRLTTASAELRSLQQKLAQYRPPFQAPLTGADVPQIAALLRTRADQLTGAGHLAQAAQALEDAAALEPHEPSTTLALAYVYARLQRTREAMELLETQPADDGRAQYVRGLAAIAAGEIESGLKPLHEALDSGAVTADVLRQEALLAPLLHDPRFQALLRPARLSSDDQPDVRVP